MSEDRLPNITMEGVTIAFRNFSGKEGQYNREGDRNFVVFLNDDVAEQMAADGYNIKHLKPRDEDEEPQAYVEVALGYKYRPPRVVMVTSRGRTNLGEDEVGILDWADIRHTDLIIRPYSWEVSGKRGVKAYVQSIFVNIEEDELEKKYADVPDSAQNTVGSDSPQEDPPWN